jgi:hypothetical protein
MREIYKYMKLIFVHLKYKIILHFHATMTSINKYDIIVDVFLDLLNLDRL